MIAWTLALSLQVGGPELPGTLSNLGLAAIALSAALACFLTGRRRSGRDRWVWTLLGGSALSWGSGQLVWFWYETVLAQEPFPSLADVGYLAAVPLAIVGLLAMPTAAQTVAGRIRAVIDGLMIATSLLLTSWVLVLGPLVREGGETVLAQAISLAYPAGDVVLVTIVVYVLLRARRTADTQSAHPLTLISAALLCFAIGDFGFSYLQLIGAYASGSIIDAGWFTGYALLLLAARKPAVAASPERDEDEGSQPLGLVLPYAAVALALLTYSAGMLFDSFELDAVTSWLRSGIIALLVVRQILTMRENLWLTRHLEARVAERTAELRASQLQLTHEASHDSLTGLANRALFKARVEHALLRTAGRPNSVAVLFLDLDGFKEVNDSLGHAVGDELLTEVGRRLRDCVRPEDTVARLGGDEFAVLVERDVTTEGAIAVAERIVADLSQRVRVSARRQPVRASVGIALARAGEGADQLLRNADLAMYRAKARGDGGHELYDPLMHIELVERLELEADLRRAVDAGELVLHYQPTVALTTGDIVGTEALVRWRHPTRGLIPPGEFIPIAEATGLIRPLGAWVLREACRQAAQWNEGRETPLSISVNLSARQIKQGPELLHEVARALQMSGLSSDRLILEVTETVLMDHAEETLALLMQLKELGVRLALDDFGTGYSSLSYLQRFPFDVIKIDRSFVERLSGPARELQLVRMIISLGRGLQMETVAEGISDPAQFLALRRTGCELGQGFYFHRPAPAATITELLAETAESRVLAA